MRVLRSLWLLTLFFYPLHSTLAHTPDEHDVSGTYFVKNVTEAGTKVVLSLEVRLNNTGEMDFSNSKAVLFSALPFEKSHGTLDPTALGPHSNTRVTQNFTVSRAEYEMWRKGAKPSLSITGQAADGSTFTRTIQLLPLRAGRN